MAKEDTVPGGLLSKVVRFVRNPSVDWSELDALGDNRESQYTRQKLKEMIERKRRNDFVRKREFDQLRKLRRKEASPDVAYDDARAQTSFLSTGLGERSERAETLRKINAIEQQMSQQWWKAHGNAPPTPTRPAPLAEEVSEPAATPGETTLPPPVSGAEAASWHDPLQAFAPTAPAGLRVDSLVNSEVPSALFTGENAAYPFTASALEAGVGAADGPREEKFVHEPDLEEAAILFANADYAGAGRCLANVLKQHEQDDPEQQHEIWMTLFDLYRATGEQASFDALAIEYAARYGRSAPLWFSIPAQLGVEPVAESEGAAQRELHWNAPATLGQQSVAALQASLARSSPPWTLNWARLASIEAAALPALVELFGQWAGQKAELRLQGLAVLQKVLQAHTVADDREVDPQWWLLRMALLRLLREADEFEEVALDYCVTYEVSPPSWADPQCQLLGDEAPGGAFAEAGLDEQALADAGAVPTKAELTGEIEGDAQAQLEPLERLMRPGQPFVVACERLIRIDFAAVGSVLNWAANQQAQGRELHFRNLHRLVAVFFNVIGISEHAWVEPRKN
ncbi:STAS domain-containing protein [Comamonas flocculans]|uniref:STAS domain-containing protein n=1 Tax=Comamonas flocculans TaxID=2597701 RepID=A0A5B8RUZ2_9BURK|nr:STAS domain-containing protein [Comamonas flocculans]QEA13341.1 STAS domain-containing protein [Comamonas flocculans]